jgi:hypothetical protein
MQTLCTIGLIALPCFIIWLIYMGMKGNGDVKAWTDRFTNQD